MLLGMKQQQLVPSIDVRTLPRSSRHPTVFSLFDQLAPGHSLELLNDHDPRPLRYLFDVRRTGSFHWDYLQAGSTVWRVRIHKLAGASDSAAAAG